ncbi:hypothetical protein PC118_g13210 [Phytophthora cactorum]|uniref:beta-glucosidase n=2 Tax=Phytophthora cactorum TaxID=29920 RepID=A0A8T1FKQ6_9STRA|nr:hypothetical protein PC118_g13210 [Phytophthora cactorum]
MGGVLFGQQINGRASFNPDLVYLAHPLWVRTFEAFGEDTYLNSVLGDAIIRGLESDNYTAACMKHWIAYMKTPSGHDKEAAQLSDYDLLNYFLPPFKAAAEARAISTMENYISINGISTIANGKLMNALLRDGLGDDGMVVSDYAEIEQLADFRRTARNYADAIHSLLSQSPQYLQHLKTSARRVVKMKLKMGLYDTPMPGEPNVTLLGNDDDVADALQLARESIVLLQNNGSTLPLPEGTPVFITGFSTYNAHLKNGITVKSGIEPIVGDYRVSFFNGLNPNGSYPESDLSVAKEIASTVEYPIAVIGEGPYAEKPVDIEDNAHTVLNGLLPCELGGQTMAEILYGKVNPSGRMPITYPKRPANIEMAYNHLVMSIYPNFTYSEHGGKGDCHVVPDPAVSLAERAGDEAAEVVLEDQFGAWPDTDRELHADGGRLERVLPSHGHGLKKVAEHCGYVVAIKPEMDCDVYNETAAANPLCATFILSTGNYPFGTLEERDKVWAT